MADQIQSKIITLISKQDEKGISLLYDNYAPSLLGIVSRIVKNKEIAEEVLQNVFLSVWNNIDGFNDKKGTFFTWMASIARNAALDQVRLKGFQVFKDAEEIDNQVINTSLSFTDTDKVDVERLLGRLEEKNKVVLDLIYLQGNSQRNVAEILDIPLGTVKSRLRVAIKVLRADLKDEEKLFLGAILILTLLNFTI